MSFALCPRTPKRSKEGDERREEGRHTAHNYMGEEEDAAGSSEGEAEMVVGDVGFGYRIRLQFKLTNMNVVYPYLVILAGFGFLLDYGLRALQAKVCPWYQNGAK